MANYLRDNIRNMSDLTQPLTQVLVEAGYTRKKKNYYAKWTSAAEMAFERIKQTINDCPKLFFIDESSPIHLYTDAS